MGEYDLVIRGGFVVDGTGAAGRVADVAIVDGRIVAVDLNVQGRGTREIAAHGLTVTPGFVDIHTHFDGQATWDPLLAPSSVHGVTSLVMGNCGVGFAPTRPTAEHHDWLIGVLEGVEDIPGTALAEGLTWDWETFPEYMDALERKAWTVDVGTHVVHAPLRAYVMGERGADPLEAPTDDELEQMTRHVRAGIDAGALGFTTSRTTAHRTRDGLPMGTRWSAEPELVALASALSDAGTGVVQLISDAYQSPDRAFVDAELALMRAVAMSSRRPLSMTVQQTDGTPDRWREMAQWIAECTADGAPIRPQVASRALGIILGLTATLNPLMTCPSFVEIAQRPLDEVVTALRDPQRRERLVVEHAAAMQDPASSLVVTGFHKMFPMSDPVDYEPSPDESLAARAVAAGVRPIEMVMDHLLADDGRCLLYMPLFNYSAGSLDDVREMLLLPDALMGLSDAGAHCGVISDGSMSTTSLSLWTRDRTRGEKLPLELMVHHITQRTARHVGWFDRGVLAPGSLADVNVIDMEALAAHPPTIVHDLPAGGRRLMQTATGYVHTFKSGVETFADGEYTGALPGRLVRGTRRNR